ncbi:cytochrome b/b6 domain-containing protein [Methylocystis sp. WRRC1]|uniref:cytochrome b n=1 Tax=Methylocystis sp. WRRC1 TaxID=1732014 RepID=UPI001D13CB8C|nr:cytochrome b/b6 domain-containing protein [Methylocystis sp. WRRC1]MCC3243934.1 cytochrome b/b6 domain-containing protein [Methylocystis sp. WRRC1]
MSVSSANFRYSPASQLFHWASVLFVGAAWAFGLLGDELPKGSIRHMGEFAHIVLGEMVVLLLVLRLVWRFVDPAPRPEPSGFGPLVDIAAKLAHLTLYGLLLAVPAVGLVTLFQGGESLSLFGLYDIPSPWPKNRELKHYAKEFHEFLAHGLIALAALHAAAALVHDRILRDRTLMRMLPAFVENLSDRRQI